MSMTLAEVITAPAPDVVPLLLVRIANGYECGRTSEEVIYTRGPAPGETLDDWWSDHVFELTGDGHSCASSENAHYEVTIIDAPGAGELAGETYSWG